MSTIVDSMRFPRGATHLVVGPSACGKTTRVANIIRHKNEMIEKGEECRNVVVCYSAWQPEYDQLKKEGVVNKWVNKMPTNEEFVQLVKKFRNGSIVVIDDFMGSINKDLDEIVRVSSRHYNVSTFILFQSLFPAHKLARQISLNVKFIHLHKNPRENAQVMFLARQLNPQSYKWIVQVYHRVTEKPYSALLFDLTQEQEPYLRFRSHYMPNELPMRVWMEKGEMLAI